MKSQFEGGYFEIGNGIIKIKEIHDNNAFNNIYVEVDDYCGNFYVNIFNKIWLNNYNLLFETNYQYLTSLNEVEEKEFEIKLIEEINDSINQIKSGEEYALLYWKKTPIRLETLRKHYVRK